MVLNCSSLENQFAISGSFMYYQSQVYCKGWKRLCGWTGW